jgi:hypothetical protein
MELNEFEIGVDFFCGERQWRCTDIGSRVISAICVTDQKQGDPDGWLVGPPYAVVEAVFDEYGMMACSIEPETIQPHFSPPRSIRRPKANLLVRLLRWFGLTMGS